MIMSFIIYTHGSLRLLEQAMKPPDLIGGVFSGLIVAVVLAVAGLVWNWTSGVVSCGHLEELPKQSYPTISLLNCGSVLARTLSLRPLLSAIATKCRLAERASWWKASD
jgi:hypothetical protein